MLLISRTIFETFGSFRVRHLNILIVSFLFISSIARFAAGHRTVYRNDLHNIYRCCISPTCPVGGGASSQHGLDIAGMKVFTFGRQHPNYDRKFVYDAIGI